MVRIGTVILLALLGGRAALCQPLTPAGRHALVLPYGIEAGAVSPDGRWFAAQGGPSEGLIVVHIASNTPVRRFRMPGLPITHFGLGYPFTAAAPRWDARSRLVWTVDADTTRNGFPVGPLQPAQAVVGQPTTLSGPRRHDDPPSDPVDRLGTLEHPAGPLDALLWADDRGRGFAQFGSKAWLRSLDEAVARPALAMVDVTERRVIASLPYADAVAPLAGAGEQLDRIKVFVGAATTLPDGRMRLFAVMNARKSRDPEQWVGAWLVWTEGEAPRLLPQHAYSEHHTRYGLTPDGAKVLVGVELGPGMICGIIGGCRVTGPPVRGPLVVAHDLSSGAPVWTLRVTAAAPRNRRTPVVSSDGRLALVELPERALAIGVVDMAAGRILQTLPGGNYPSFGFFQEGRCAFVQAPHQVQLYEVAAATSASPSRPVDKAPSRCLAPATID
jgi:hypothetical protein